MNSNGIAISNLRFIGFTSTEAVNFAAAPGLVVSSMKSTTVKAGIATRIVKRAGVGRAMVRHTGCCVMVVAQSSVLGGLPTMMMVVLVLMGRGVQ